MSYKIVQQKACISSLIEDGYSLFEELGSECDEAANNFPNSSHPKAEAFAEAASTLQGLQAPDLPDVLTENDRETTWGESVNRDKRKGPSRAIRASNGSAMLSAAAEAIRELAEELREKAKTLGGQEPEEGKDDETDAEDELEPKVQELEELADQLENDGQEAEGVEFPGLYG